MSLSGTCEQDERQQKARGSGSVQPEKMRRGMEKRECREHRGVERRTVQRAERREQRVETQSGEHRAEKAESRKQERKQRKQKKHMRGKGIQSRKENRGHIGYGVEQVGKGEAREARKTRDSRGARENMSGERGGPWAHRIRR
jgi:hypothetical protein